MERKLHRTVRPPEMLHSEKPVLAVVLVVPELFYLHVFGFFEVRQHIVEAPAWISQFFPSIVVLFVPSDVEHCIENATTAQHLTSGPVASSFDHGLAVVVSRLSFEFPIQRGQLECRKHHRHVGDGQLVRS